MTPKIDVDDGIREISALGDPTWLAERIHPHKQALADIFNAGGIAVLVHEPSAEMGEMARGLGWSGAEPHVFRMSAAGRRQLVEAVRGFDPIMEAWLTRKQGWRVYVIEGDVEFLLNHTGKGWAPEMRESDLLIEHAEEPS